MIKIIEATNKRLMKKFAKYPVKLYEGCDHYVPSFVVDEKNIRNPKKYFAAEGCAVKCFLAYRGAKIVGRIAGVIVEESNRKFSEKKIRFSRFDFSDDPEAKEALLNAVENFGRESGMEYMHGPWGFNDTEREGMLVEGFDSQATYATNYNYEYYADGMDKLGFFKEREWVEYRFYPETLDPRIHKTAEFVRKRSGFVELADIYPMSKIIKDYGDKFFDCYNDAYKDLACYVELKGAVKKAIIKQFASVINPDYFSCVLDPKTGKIAAFGIAIPAIGKAVKKHKGSVVRSAFSILREIAKPTALELTLIGVSPEYRNSGVNSMVISRIHKNVMKNGITDVVSNPMLVDNAEVLAQWKWVEHDEIKRRATFVKPIEKGV